MGFKEAVNNRKLQKMSSIWKSNNELLSNPWVKENISRKIGKYFELTEDKNRKIFRIQLKQYLEGNL